MRMSHGCNWLSVVAELGQRVVSQEAGCFSQRDHSADTWHEEPESESDEFNHTNVSVVNNTSRRQHDCYYP
ncbi:uncharacterized protein V6R79_018556 [Siganus canaliculatus]